MIATAIPDPLVSPAHRMGLATIVVTTCTINVLSLIFPLVTLQIYDRVLHSQNVGTLHVLAICVIAAVVFETFLRILRSHLISYRGATYVHGLKCDAVSLQLEGRCANAKSSASSEELAAIDAIRNLKDFKSGNSVVIWVDLMFIPLFIAVMASISQMLVLVPLGIICCFALYSAYCGIGVRSSLNRTSAADVARYDLLIQCLTNIKLLKSNASEKFIQRRFEKLHNDSCTESYNLSRHVTQSFVQSAAVSHAMTIATVSAGAYFVVYGDLTIGALIAVVQLSSRLMQPVQKAVLLWLKYQDYRSSQEKANTLFECNAPAADTAHVAVKNLGNLRLKQVQYRTRKDAPLKLTDVDLQLTQGDCMVIHGIHNAGKSTLLELIVGVRRSSGGEIFLNDVSIDKLSAQQIGQCVGYLHPNSVLLRGTIRDNITRFGAVPVAQAMEVAGLLGLSDDFARLPRGIDTMVGPGSKQMLTPGLTQMVCNLRALAAKPRIVLFDEADSGLDSNYYGRLLALIGRIRPNVAMLMVSRDMNIRKLANRQATLSDGRLIESNVRPFLANRTQARM